MIQELDRVALTEDIPAHGLKRGDIGVVVLVHEKPGFEVEFHTLDGGTHAVLSAHPHQIRALGRREVAQARQLEAA